MLTILAYLIVIVLGQFAFTIGMFIGTLVTLPFNLVADYIFSENLRATAIRSLVMSVIAGISCSLGSIAFAWLIFRIMVGTESYGVFPFLATLLSIAIPIYNDINRYLDLKKVRVEAKDELSDNAFEAVSEVTAPTMKASGGIIIGEFVGILLSGIIFLVS